MNIVIITGRLTADAESSYTKNGNQVINFCVANETGYGEKKQTSFLNCQYWTKTRVGDYLQKGKAIILQGEIIQQRWEKEGQKQSKILINVRDIQFQQGNTTNSQAMQQPTGWEESDVDMPF